MEFRRQESEFSRSPSKTFRDLIVWQNAHRLALEVYKYSKGFPREELFGITSQMRRSAVSVPANIAEGFAKFSDRDKIRFFNIAQGSLQECRYFILLSKDLGFGENKPLEELAEETSKLLSSYINAIRKKIGTHS